MAIPSSGLRRSYNCSALLAGGKFLLCGTDVGDMVVYGCVKKKSGVALHSPCSLIERRTWCQKAQPGTLRKKCKAFFAVTLAGDSPRC